MGSTSRTAILVRITYPPGEQKAGGVSGGVVSQGDVNSISGQLVGISRAHHLVTLQVSVGNLAGDVLVGNPHDHAVLGGVVLVLVL